ncbi:MAG: hypothetical protein AAF989_10460, partial [Planctomycetota bacterium]
GRITWNVPRLAPQTEIELFADVTLENSAILTFNARGEPALSATDSVRTNVYRPALSLSVVPRQDRVESGQPVTFDIRVKNTGSEPLSNAVLRGIGGGSMIDSEFGDPSVRKPREDGPLLPGDTWEADVTFVPTDSGRRCITVEATADGGQRASQEACVTVINPVPPAPAMSVTLDARERMQVGESRSFVGQVTNTGDVPLDNVRAVMVFDPQLQAIEGTTGVDDSRVDQYLLSWDIPRLEPGMTTKLQAYFEGIAPADNSRVIFTAESDQGARGEASRSVQILPASPVDSIPAPNSASDLPLGGPAPLIPSGPAPLTNETRPAPNTRPVAPPLQPTQRQGLRINILQREISPRVNASIPYAVSITNDSNERDRNITVEIELPPWVRVESIRQTRNPELNRLQSFGDRVLLEPIGLMRPGETIDFEMRLLSTLAREFELKMEARSDVYPSGVAATETTQVSP